MTRHVIVIVLSCAVSSVAGTAHAQEESSLDGLVGAGMLLYDGGAATGESGVALCCLLVQGTIPLTLEAMRYPRWST